MCPPSVPFWFAPRGIAPDYELGSGDRRRVTILTGLGAGLFILFVSTAVNVLVIPLAGHWLLKHADGNPQRYAQGVVLLIAVAASAITGAIVWWRLRRTAVMRAYDRQHHPPPPRGAALAAFPPESKDAPAPSTAPTTPPDTKDSTP